MFDPREPIRRHPTVRIEHGHPTGRHRFTLVHTSDWQLGMKRWFLSPEGASTPSTSLRGSATSATTLVGESQAKFTEARFQAIENIAQLAKHVEAGAVLVAGDVFEHPTIAENHQRRFLEALGHFDVPVYFLPGNHDPFQVDSLWRNTTFMAEVEKRGGAVLTTNEPLTIAPGVELLGAPLTSNTPTKDLVNEALEGLPPAEGIRIVLGHGATGSWGGVSEAVIDPQRVDDAVAEHRADYIAMGDTHSTQQIDRLGAMWYSGSPVVTDFDDHERSSGRALVTTISVGDGSTELDIAEYEISDWRFHALDAAITSEEDIDALERSLASFTSPSRTVVKYSLEGQVTMRLHARLMRMLDAHKPAFAGFYPRERTMNLVVTPDALDRESLGVHGYLADAVDELMENSDQTSVDALALLYRLMQSDHNSGGISGTGQQSGLAVNAKEAAR